MARSPSPHPNAKRIGSPAVRERILATLGKRMQRADAEDAMQKVYVRLLLLVEELPEDDDQLLALVTVVAKGKVVDHYRRVAVDEARRGDESEGEEVHLPPEVISDQQRAEWKRLLEFAKKLEERGEVDASFLRVAARLAMGDTYEDIAVDEGIEPPALRKRMERERKRITARWIGATGLGGAVLAGVLAIFLRHPEPAIAPATDTAPTPTATTSAVVEETPDQAAARLRKDADTACTETYVDICEKLLDEAKALDPAGEERPEVIKMRHFIANVKQHGLKP